MSARSAERKEPNAPWYTKVFVLFHIICITSWALPNAKPAQVSGQVAVPVTSVGDWLRLQNNLHVKTFGPFQAYLLTTGFWQYWDMFAPNPAQTDWYGDAEITYRDGTKRTYQYPRIYKLPLQNKYTHERYRKFYERANADNTSYIWPQFALHIAFLNDDPKNPPVSVRLTRHWLPIAPPGKPQQQEYSSYSYFEYIVDQRALARMRTGRA